VGARPPGLVCRHGNGDCRDNRIINLSYSTHSVNIRDKRAHGTDHNINKTHCPQGHPYFGENLYISPARRRSCRTCTRANKAQQVAS